MSRVIVSAHRTITSVGTSSGEGNRANPRRAGAVGWLARKDSNTEDDSRATEHTEICFRRTHTHSLDPPWSFVALRILRVNILLFLEGAGRSPECPGRWAIALTRSLGRVSSGPRCGGLSASTSRARADPPKSRDGSACPKASRAFDLLAADSAGKIRCPLGHGARHRALGHS
jgi:hypothetical protein